MKQLKAIGLVTVIISVATLSAATPAHAQFLGQVSTARTLVPRANDVGGYIGLFDGYTTLFGQYRRGLSSSLDFGLQGGLIDPDVRGADAGLILGGDLKYSVMSTGYDPFDMALDLRGSFYEFGNVTVTSLGGAVILSRDYAIEGGGVLTPYGAVNIRLEHASYDAVYFSDEARLRAKTVANGLNASDTDLEIGGSVGVKWELSDFIDALGEVVLDKEWGLILGLNFKL